MHRPLLDGDRLTELRKLMTEREALYAEVADTTINVAGRKVEDIADDVVAALDHVAEAGLK
jgi:shikimate kinase